MAFLKGAFELNSFVFIFLFKTLNVDLSYFTSNPAIQQ